MKLRIFFVLLALFFIAETCTTNAQSPLNVCPNPSAPCKTPAKTFQPYDLTFNLPRKLKSNFEYRTNSFYAVILKTFPKFQAGDDCDGGEYAIGIEGERKQTQKLFPERKVFASYQCPDMGAVFYVLNGKEDNTVFIAVYGGANESEARQVLKKTQRNFPQALIKKMQVGYVQEW